MNYRSAAEQIFLAGVERVLPDRLISKSISIEDSCLTIGDHFFRLDAFENIYVIGAGKASALMGAQVEKILGDRISGGHIVVKYGHSCPLMRIEVSEAGHPVPDANSFTAAKSILEICGRTLDNDLVICLLSGGGSSLLYDCPDGINPDKMADFNRLMVNCGASIGEINTLRKHLSKVKGGQLAKAVYPATLVSLILSDVINDPLDVIASGPTVPDPSTFRQALGILKKYNLVDTVLPAIIDHLQSGAEGSLPETPKEADRVFDKTYNILVGNNKLALEAAMVKSFELNINALIIDDKLDGDVRLIAQDIIETALRFRNDPEVTKPVCLLFGGEPVVKVTGAGEGGRNQHLALHFATLLTGHQGITLLAAGTDGSDGPTGAAGAVVDCATIKYALIKSIDPSEYLQRFDSFNFFSKAGGHIITGPTMTNVMDIIVVLVT